MGTKWISLCCGAVLAVASGCAVSPIGDNPVTDSDWRSYSGDNGSTKYAPLAQISKENVAGLQIAWRRPSLSQEFKAANPDIKALNNFRATPIKVGSVLYASTGVGLAQAFDPATGKTLWEQKLPPEGVRGSSSNRGVAYWQKGSEGRLFSYTNNFLYALDPKTGEPLASFGKDGRVDLNEAMGGAPFRWNSPPLVVRDVVVIGSAMVDQDSASKKEGVPGDVHAYDVRTGKLRWTFRIVPRPGEEGNETWKEGSWAYSGAGNVWAPMSGDDELGYVYLPTTSVTNDMYGGHRPGDNLFSDSVVALDAATGKKVWHYQIVHHDLFDYDNPAAPILADINVDGRRIKALVQITKQSFAYVLDRVTGKPVWPIEERPVPASTVPGEQASPTQPHPMKPPAFDRQGISTDDLIDFTPELRAEALEIAKNYVIGPLFTPPSVVGQGPGATKGTIQLPGSVGGADWTGAGFDPVTGYLYVPSMTNPFIANLLPTTPDETNLRYRAGSRALIQGPRGLPLTKPPYGRITAIDLSKGDIVWTVANGDGPRNHPAIAHLKLGPLGNAVRAAPLVTKTLLFVSEGDQINVRTPPGGGGNKLRAFDKATGDVVWETTLDAGTTGTLMTYMQKGKQYIVVAIGGAGHDGEFLAYALP
jgi:quinoprotein glucose dehydrogenase